MHFFKKYLVETIENLINEIKEAEGNDLLINELCDEMEPFLNQLTKLREKNI